jgi:hypothetical protein
MTHPSVDHICIFAAENGTLKERDLSERTPLARPFRVAARVLLCLVSTTGVCMTQPSSDATHATSRLAFLSDTQTPLWLESLVLGSERNEEATDSLFADILRLHPSRLFMLGDLVSFGAYPVAWESMDRKIQNTRDAGIPVHAILGNHELAFYPHTGERYFSQTFPDHRETGYCVSADSVAVVLLNSNFDMLDQEERIDQQRWYLKTLDSLSTDQGTLCIVVCAHHSPYTNSSVVEASADVRKLFVPPFVSCPKCLVFFSGHSHNLEQFAYHGKNFLVIGGGGGSRQRLFKPADRDWEDISPEKKPRFHYVMLERHGTSLRVMVRQLREDFKSVDDGYSFIVSNE